MELNGVKFPAFQRGRQIFLLDSPEQSVRKNSFLVPQGFLQIGIREINVRAIGSPEIDLPKLGTSESRTPQDGFAKDASPPVEMREISVQYPGPFKFRFPAVSKAEVARDDLRVGEFSHPKRAEHEGRVGRIYQNQFGGSEHREIEIRADEQLARKVPPCQILHLEIENSSTFPASSHDIPPKQNLITNYVLKNYK
jgi:hypothetical protein